MGSVKDLKIIEWGSEEQPGLGRFIFSDRYSVFDWGEMPDEIHNKGKALCLMTAYFFERLEEQGMKTHYRGLVEDGRVKKLKELKEPSSEMQVLIVSVFEPAYTAGKYDYSIYNAGLKNCLLPLEIIYRNTLPEQSSFRKRAEEGKLDPVEYGLDSLPEPGVFLKEPVFDVSTKLEATDRYISWKEARKLAAISEQEYQQIIELLKMVNGLISHEVEKAGLKNLDGKIELAFDSERQLMVVDALGTPDECRFSLDGVNISKEYIRRHYRQTDWYQELMKQKKEAGPGWKRKVESPGKLPGELLEKVSEMYMACANEVTGRKWFKGAPALQEICLKLKETR